MNVRTWLIHLYPRGWRERYGDEFEALLEECLHSPLDVLDIMLGALDAHLELSHETDWRSMNMSNKLRTTILLVFAGYIGFIIGGLSLYGLADDSPMAVLMKTDASLFTAWVTVQAGAVIALLAVVFGGLPIAWTVIHRAITSSRRDLRLLLVPVYAFLAVVLYVFFIILVGSGRIQIPGVIPSVSHNNFPIGNRIIIGGFMLLRITGAIASAVAVWKVISNTDAEENTFRVFGHKTSIRLYEHAFVPAVITTLAMLLMLIASIVWGWLAYSAMPQVFAENWGVLLINTTASLMLTLLIMTISTGVAIYGLIRGASARKMSIGHA